MTRRTTLTLSLVPVAGARFQPTGFPNLGAAVFQRFDIDKNEWVESLHVESPQSMANRFELTTWNTAEQRPVDDFAQIPYVEVVDGNGEFLTSSRLEAHRLASAYVLEATLEGKKRSRSCFPPVWGWSPEDRSITVRWREPYST